MSKKNDNLITILLTNNRQILKVAMALLDDAGVSYFVKTEEISENEEQKNENINDSLTSQIELQVSSENSIQSKSLIADLQELDFEE
jgi:hypothetical protein